jgi:hypothetical protein
MPNRTARLIKSIGYCLLVLVVAVARKGVAEEVWNSGLLYDQFPLTLEAGQRTEAFGPLFYQQEREDDHTIAVPPLFSHTTSTATDSEEFDFIYPLLTLDRYGREYRWQLFQLLSYSGGQNQAEVTKRTFTLFPFYFQQRSADPEQNYTAVFPIYGQLKNRLFRSEMEWVMWPLYIKTKRRPSASTNPDDPYLALPNRYLSARRGDITTYNFLFPFFHLRYGEGLEGWQFLPLLGHEHKAVTTHTNIWGDIQTIPGYDYKFLLWPIYFNEHRYTGSDNPEHQVAVLPFYSRLRSPQRDSTSYLSPLGLTITDDRVRKYHEVDAPWPFIVFARGEGKTTSRVWPLFSQSHNATTESDFYLWPLVKYNRIHSDPLDRSRTRILFFLFSHINQKSTETGKYSTRTDLWPLFYHRREMDGSTRLQLLAGIESFLPTSKSVERDLSPVWSLWRSENNVTTGAASQSLLWNLYRHETTPTTKKSSLLFGLFQYSSVAETRRWRLFYIPFGQTPTRPDGPTK